ncbi:IS66 family transposase [Clostridium beijerinckii]|uniref:IS66 family transposase n=1 Tax=Clostridium beijerinckii TaxID=1520 RepID=UPI0015CDE820|nr:hypothetical protein [Clostridium beijerinckii]NYC01730.1 hypothetical protein [Clostridium beijerinckii]
MKNNENTNWREIVATFSYYEGTLGNFCNANHITKSHFGKALVYAQKLLPYMRIFLTNGCLEIDNNAAQESINPFVIGIKNWMFSTTAKRRSVKCTSL